MSSSAIKNEPKATGGAIDSDKLTVDLADGRSLTVPLHWYPRLSHATPHERQNWTLLGGGYSIHWPDLDEDIGVEGLLAGNKSGESSSSFKRWLAGRKRN